MYYITKNTAGKLKNRYVEGFKECCKKSFTCNHSNLT